MAKLDNSSNNLNSLNRCSSSNSQGNYLNSSRLIKSLQDSSNNSYHSNRCKINKSLQLVSKFLKITLSPNNNHNHNNSSSNHNMISNYSLSNYKTNNNLYLRYKYRTQLTNSNHIFIHHQLNNMFTRIDQPTHNKENDKIRCLYIERIKKKIAL